MLERERQVPYDNIYEWMQNSTLMNLSMRQNQTHRRREQTCGYWARKREGWIGSLGLADAIIYTDGMNKQQNPNL